MQAKTHCHERFLKRRHNLLDITVCNKHDTPNGQQNNNDMDESDEQLRNDNTHDDDESLTFDNTEGDPVTLAIPNIDDPVTFANTVCAPMLEKASPWHQFTHLLNKMVPSLLSRIVDPKLVQIVDPKLVQIIFTCFSYAPYKGFPSINNILMRVLFVPFSLHTFFVGLPELA